MTIELESGVRVGDFQVAALVRRTVGRESGRRAQYCWIAKQPLAILIADGADVRAFDLDGKPLSLDLVERLRPGTKDAIGQQTR